VVLMRCVVVVVLRVLCVCVYIGLLVFV